MKLLQTRILKWLNKINPDGKYKEIAEFLMDFHSPKENNKTTLTTDKEYKDYQWWLAKDKDGGWEIVTSGYGEQ